MAIACKIHALVDALGNPLRFLLSSGQRHDLTQAVALLKDTRNTIVIADRGYDSDALRQQLYAQNCSSVIPTKCSRKNQIKYDRSLYGERYVVECFFSKIKHFRRIFSRFDKAARNFSAFLSFCRSFDMVTLKNQQNLVRGRILKAIEISGLKMGLNGFRQIKNPLIGISMDN